MASGARYPGRHHGGQPGSPDLLPKLDLWHLDVESGALQRVTDLGRAYRPFYSPDGTQIALLQYGTDSDPIGELTLVNAGMAQTVSRGHTLPRRFDRVQLRFADRVVARWERPVGIRLRPFDKLRYGWCASRG